MFEYAVGAGEVADHDVECDVGDGKAVASVVVVGRAYPCDVVHGYFSLWFGLSGFWLKIFMNSA